MQDVNRYHPALVTLHWLLALLIIGALIIGFFVLAPMVARFIVRMLTSRPARATTGNPLLDRIAPITHYGFYVLVLLMVASGYTTAILAGLNRIVFQGSGE